MSTHDTPTRRQVLLGLSALAASPAIWPAEATRPSAIVDVHAHFQPEVLRALGIPGPMGSWSVQKHLDDMAAAGVTRSVLFTAQTNRPAQRAYEALGYRIAGDFALVLLA